MEGEDNLVWYGWCSLFTSLLHHAPVVGFAFRHYFVLFSHAGIFMLVRAQWHYSVGWSYSHEVKHCPIKFIHKIILHCIFTGHNIVYLPCYTFWFHLLCCVYINRFSYWPALGPKIFVPEYLVLASPFSFAHSNHWVHF